MATDKGDDDGSVFPARLKAARELRQLSQGALAEKAKLPPSSISHFEANKRKPSFDNLRKLASVLGVTTDYLLGRVESPEPAPEAEVMFRDVQKLSDRDRELASDFIKMLVNKRGGA